MKKNIQVLQEEVSDCGICSLASIIKYYGGDVSLELLRYYTNTSYDGTNALELINCAKRLGFDAYGEKTCNLIINQPVIAHLKLNNDFFHFVVVYEANEDYVIIMDPSCGIKKIKNSDFYKLFTGVLIHFFPLEKIPKYKVNKYFYKKVFEEISNNKIVYIILFFISLLIFLFTMISNFEIKILNYSSIYFYVLLFIILINNILIYFKNNLLLKCSIRFNKNIIEYFIKHIFKLPLNYLKLKQKGEISTRFNELNDISNNLLHFILELIYTTVLVILTLVSFILFSYKIFIFIFFFSLIYLVFNFKIYKKLVNDIRYSINMEENYNSNILDYISNFNTIKHLNIYDYFIKNIINNLVNRNSVTLSINKKINLIDFINSLFLSIFLLFVLKMILTNSYTITNRLVIYILFSFYLSNLKVLINYYPSILIYKTFINKSNDFFTINEEIKISVNNFTHIIIKNLSYKSINKVILNNINYKINNSDKIFISGPSGIGKSTLMKILNNEINRYNGDVLVDGKSIKELDVSNLITYVSQNESIFNDSIYNNILIGKSVSSEELEKVIKITRLNEINVIKNQGLDFNIINGNYLSGGEKNRLILARSLIHSNNILILDEVLKEVDIKLEREIIKDILKYYSNKTIIYISHKDVGDLFFKVLTF